MLNPVSKEVSGNKEKVGKFKYIFRVQLFFGNKSQQSITNFSSSIQSTAELEVSEKQPVPAQVNPGEQIVQIFNIQCNKVKIDFFFLEIYTVKNPTRSLRFQLHFIEK